MMSEDTVLTDPCDRVLVRYVIPSAINCFFHVYEERVGTYGLRILKHVLVCPGQYARPVMKTGCDRAIDQHEYVTVSNDIVVDRTWCKACADAIDEESKRGHSPTRLDEKQWRREDEDNNKDGN